MQLPVGFRDRIDVQQSIGAAFDPELRCGGIQLVAIDAAVDDDMRHVNPQRTEFARHRLGDRAKAEHHLSAAATMYRIQNTGTTAYHAIEVENLREDGKWRVATGDQATVKRFLASNPAFRKGFKIRPPRIYIKQDNKWVEFSPPRDAGRRG